MNLPSIPPAAIRRLRQTANTFKPHSGDNQSDRGPYCVSLEDIRSAAHRIGSYIMETPVLHSEPMNSEMGMQLFFKCENLQHIGAFKARGACNAVMSLSETDASAGVVTHSSGNHAAALARAARIRGIAAHIVMPHNSAVVKLNAVQRLGITPILCEPSAAAREAMANEVMARTGATLIHPYNNVDVIAGQGTVALELLRQVGQLDAVICPVGGGGLLSGSLIAIKTLYPNIKVYAAEPARADDCARSIDSGSIQQNSRYDTIADGLRTPLGTLTFPIIYALVDDVLLVDEHSILPAAEHMQSDLRMIVEPSAAVPLAAIRKYPQLFKDQRVGVIVSGGNRDSANSSN